MKHTIKACPACLSDDIYLEAYFTKSPNGLNEWEFEESGLAFCRSCQWQGDWDELEEIEVEEEVEFYEDN